MTKVFYFPFLEFSLLAFAIALLGIGVYNGLNPWLCMILTLFAYTQTVARSNILRLTNEQIVIIPLIPFRVKHSINLESVITVYSHQSYTLESDVRTENTYPIFKKRYYLEYLGKDGQKITVYFSINNKQKEKELMSAIKDHAG